MIVILGQCDRFLSSGSYNIDNKVLTLPMFYHFAITKAVNFKFMFILLLVINTKGLLMLDWWKQKGHIFEVWGAAIRGSNKMRLKKTK